MCNKCSEYHLKNNCFRHCCESSSNARRLRWCYTSCQVPLVLSVMLITTFQICSTLCWMLQLFHWKFLKQMQAISRFGVDPSPITPTTALFGGVFIIVNRTYTPLLICWKVPCVSGRYGRKTLDQVAERVVTVRRWEWWPNGGVLEEKLPTKRKLQIFSRTQHYPVRGADFTSNLYIQIVYTIGKLCTLLKKFVHYTILSVQEWAPWVWKVWQVWVLVAMHSIIVHRTFQSDQRLKCKIVHIWQRKH